MNSASKRIKFSQSIEIVSEMDWTDAVKRSVETSKLEKLNDYALFEIFNHLPLNSILSIKQINKRFYCLVENYFVKIDEVLVHVDANYRFESCSEHQPTKLNCINSVDNMKKFLRNFLNKLIRLKVLNLCFLTIDERDLIAFTNLPCIGTSLKHLEISRCEFKNFYLTAKLTYEKFFEKLGDRLEHLIFYKNSSYLVPVNYLLQNINKYLINLCTLVLDLKQYEHFASSEHLKNCTKLRQLNLHGFYWSKNSTVDRFIAKTIDGKRIEHLNLRCLTMSKNNLFYTIHNCPNLKILKFSYDYSDDNQFGRQLITNNCVFQHSYFQNLREMRQDDTIVTQFTLAATIASLKYLEELHLTEIVSGDVNIDPLILYLYHHFKRNNLRRLLIANYEVHLINVKAFCYVTKKLEVLCLNELSSCCYKTHNYQSNARLTRTVNESFIKTVKWLPDLTTLSLNQCNISFKILRSLLLNECQSKVVNFSFVRCAKLNDSNCIDLFITYANSNPELRITVKLDEHFVEHIENKKGTLFNICPRNLQIISV